MRAPAVVLHLDDGRTSVVPVGGLLGRGGAASLRIPDASVSEAHAMVSLRGRELRLLALRGRVTVDDHEGDDFILLPGQRITLGATFGCTVAEVRVPDEVLALEFSSSLRELCAEAYSFVLQPTLDLVPRFLPDSPAHVWATDDGWMIRLAGEPPSRLQIGRSWTVGGTEVTVRAVPLAHATAVATTGPREALRLVCRTTTVHIHRVRREPVAVDARAGQLLSELALMAAPVEWAVMARLLWPDERDSMRLRRNFDAVLARLRVRLRETGIREDLVRTDGRGNIEVFLERNDRVVDEA